MPLPELLHKLSRLQKQSPSSVFIESPISMKWNLYSKIYPVKESESLIFLPTPTPTLTPIPTPTPTLAKSSRLLDSDSDFTPLATVYHYHLPYNNYHSFPHQTEVLQFCHPMVHSPHHKGSLQCSCDVHFPSSSLSLQAWK
ncbi:hypothetical protein E2C01_007653 [Portunus trituberculatus]|uniref:Uncharacterized protein n=1 Tax=Portunus trituberculatus TaxID=210409 RepID=A0A5B7CYP5_PORTR|nr:hypothetical protein [Portunus trituberculatus]